MGKLLYHNSQSQMLHVWNIYLYIWLIFLSWRFTMHNPWRNNHHFLYVGLWTTYFWKGLSSKRFTSIFDKWWQQLPGAMPVETLVQSADFQLPALRFLSGSTKNQTKFTKHMAKTTPHIIPRSFELESSINDPSICLRYCWWTKSCTTWGW